jgi:DNA-binding NarL/FixJ family response regulator
MRSRSRGTDEEPEPQPLEKDKMPVSKLTPRETQVLNAIARGPFFS